MIKKILIRLLQLIPVLFGVTLLSFFLSYLAPSDPAQIMLTEMGIAPTAEVLEQTREEMGLNDPVYVQYVRWLSGILHGDFGTSYQYQKGVFTVLISKLSATLKLTGFSLLLMIVVAFPLGVLSAVYQNRWLDYICRFFSVFSLSMPSFWLGLLMLYFFSYRWKLLPVLSGGSFKGLIMPSVVLATSLCGQYIRQMRTAVLEELNQEYVKGAVSRGIPDQKILLNHVIPNAIPSAVSMLGLSIGGLLGGSAIVETIFVWPGVGQLAIDAISKRDYPLIQGYVIWMAVIYVFLNLIVDIIYLLLYHNNDENTTY